MTKEERLNWLKQIEKDIDVCSLDATFEETAKSCAIRSAIEELEERKTGRWIRDRYCSNCGWSNEDVYFTSNWTGKYCPDCGAKMEGAE